MGVTVSIIKGISDLDEGDFEGAVKNLIGAATGIVVGINNNLKTQGIPCKISAEVTVTLRTQTTAPVPMTFRVEATEDDQSE